MPNGYMFVNSNY